MYPVMQDKKSFYYVMRIGFYTRDFFMFFHFQESDRALKAMKAARDAQMKIRREAEYLKHLDRTESIRK